MINFIKGILVVLKYLTLINAVKGGMFYVLSKVKPGMIC